jgi:hypothetical protein
LPSWFLPTTLLLLGGSSPLAAEPARERFEIPPELLRSARKLQKDIKAEAEERPKEQTLGGGEVRFARDVPERLRIQFFDDMREVTAIRGGNGSPLYRRFFGGPVDGRILARWLRDRIRSVGVGICYSGDASQCYLPGGRLQFQFPDLHVLYDRWHRLATIIHEARHSNGIFHRPCLYPDESKLQRIPIWREAKKLSEKMPHDEWGLWCDWSIDGPIGYETVAMLNISRYCTNCGESDRAEARKAGLHAAFLRLASLEAWEALDRDSR